MKRIINITNLIRWSGAALCLALLCCALASAQEAAESDLKAALEEAVRAAKEDAAKAAVEAVKAAEEAKKAAAKTAAETLAEVRPIAFCGRKSCRSERFRFVVRGRRDADTVLSASRSDPQIGCSSG